MSTLLKSVDRNTEVLSYIYNHLCTSSSTGSLIRKKTFQFVESAGILRNGTTVQI